MTFPIAFEELILIEGGYNHDPFDRGGKTKFGVSQQSYPDLDIENLTLEDAQAIYRRDYWDALRLDQVDSDLISHEMFDTAVNMWVVVAAKCAQKAANLLSPGSLKVDGLFGPRSVAVINQTASVNVYALFKAMNGYQFMEYVDIIENKPKQIRFIKGWMKRIQDFGGR